MLFWEAGCTPAVPIRAEDDVRFDEGVFVGADSASGPPDGANIVVLDGEDLASNGDDARFNGAEGVLSRGHGLSDARRWLDLGLAAASDELVPSTFDVVDWAGDGGLGLGRSGGVFWEAHISSLLILGVGIPRLAVVRACVWILLPKSCHLASHSSLTSLS